MKFIVGDDHQIYRAGLSLVLENAIDGCEVICVDSYTAVAKLAATCTNTDLYLVDLFMPGLDENTTLQSICETASPAPVVVLSGSKDSGHIRTAMNAGARGYLFKTMSNEQIALAIQMVLSGETYLPAQFVSQILEGGTDNYALIQELPTRQSEVFGMIMDGKSNKEIALALEISISTVKNHIALIMRRLNVSNRQEMIATYK